MTGNIKDSTKPAQAGFLLPVWFCLASGPSMTQADADAVRGRGTVVAINNTVSLAPWADVLYACDVKWWRTYGNLPHVAGFAGRRVCLRTEEQPPAGVEALAWQDQEGLGRTKLHAGGNGGFQAINYAYLQGARTIVLLGYDMQATGGRMHWHRDHPQRIGNINARVMEVFRHRMRFIARDLEAEGVRVVNCSRHTALDCFERMTLEQALSQLPNPAKAGNTAGLVPVFS